MSELMMFIYPVYLLGVVFLFLLSIYRFIVIPWFKRPKNLTLDECLDILSRIISIELELYYNDIFDGVETITNSQYENHIRLVCERIDGAISPELIEYASVYMSEDEIYTWIIRLVRRYFDETANFDVIIEDNQEEKEE